MEVDPQPERIERDRLALELGEVIDRIPAKIPAVFKEQATKATDFIQSLDSGLPPEDPGLKNFLTQLGSTGYIIHVLLDFKFRDAPDPKVALPFWLQKTYLRQFGFFKGNHPLNSEGIDQVDYYFNTWMGDKKYPSQKRPNGKYYYPLSQQKPKLTGSEYKAYIEQSVLLENLRSGRLQNILSELIQNDTGPAQMKNADDGRLVLYFDNNQQLQDFEEAMQQSGIEYRGPAQDVIQLRINQEGGMSVEVKYSNDQALGEGGGLPFDLDYKIKEYNSVDFLEGYLNLCLQTGKNPAAPFKTSFIYIEDRKGLGEGREQELLEVAQTMVDYPVVYTQHRMHERILHKESKDQESSLSQTTIQPANSQSRFRRWFNRLKK